MVAVEAPSGAEAEVSTGPRMLIRTYKYRAYPTKSQIASVEAQLRFACGLYNSALDERITTHRSAERETGRRRPWHPLDGDKRPGPIRLWNTEAGKYEAVAAPKGLSRYDQSKRLTEYRRAHPDDYPEGMSALVMVEVLQRVERAFNAFFRRVKEGGGRAGFPRYRSARRYDSLTFGLTHGTTSGAGTLRGEQLRLTGVGDLKVRWHRPVPSDAVARSVVLRRSCGRWYVSIVLEMVAPAVPAEDTRPEVGVDMGVLQWMTLSTGETIDTPMPGRKGPRRRGQKRPRPTKSARRVRIHQRTLSRRTKLGHKHSNRRAKAVAMLARAREDERNQRKDHRHKVAHDLTRRFGTIYVEDLSETKMTRSETGTVEEPNPRSGLKRDLNRRILDQAWHEAHLALDYKAEEAGGRVVRVPPMNTTRLCSECGWLSPVPITGRVFYCPACGYTVARPHNSARNIERIGRDLNLVPTDRGRAGPSGGNGGGLPRAVA